MNRDQRRRQKIYWAWVKLGWAIGRSNAPMRAYRRGASPLHVLLLAQRAMQAETVNRVYRCLDKLAELGGIVW